MSDRSVIHNPFMIAGVLDKLDLYCSEVAAAQGPLVIRPVEPLTRFKAGNQNVTLFIFGRVALVKPRF
jgi:hypothetical protein